MMIIAAAAAALLVATPTDTSAAPTDVKSAPTESTAKNKTPDLGELMKMFDKLFPPQPDPDPARLALARQSAQGLLPDGVYGKAMTGMLDGFADKILNMSDADFETKAKDGKQPSNETLRQSLAKGDPHFDERMAIIRRIISEELVKLSAVLEPRMRDGLARSMARRFEAKQLVDLNAFLATDSGKAYGQQSMAMWVDPDVLRSIVGAMPDMILALPGAAARIESETAHLPKPKKAKPAEKAEPNAD